MPRRRAFSQPELPFGGAPRSRARRTPARGPEAAEAKPGYEGLADPNAQRVYTVSELLSEATDLAETAFPSVWVKGEITGFRGAHSSGHMYFQVKDAQAVLEVAFFRGANRKLKFRLENGMEVLLMGRCSIYGRSSRFQMIPEHVEPAGIGALQMRIEQLKKKLEAEGLFDPDRKRALPELPRRIAVVTSPEGAAIRDFLKVTRMRFPGQHLVIFPVLVQGEQAPAQIVEAVEEANAMGDFDALVVCRGGGSLEDLMAFNDEGVARAIAGSATPVVCGVGHERDVSIADLVADVRAATPSQAAELVTPSRSEILGHLRELQGRLDRYMRGIIDTAAQALDDLQDAATGALKDRVRDLIHEVRELGARVRARAPGEVLARQRQLLEQLASRATAAATRRGGEARIRLQGLAGRLDALSPLAVLGRGYSIAFAEPGNRVIKDAAGVRPGQALRIKLHRGAVRATANSTEEE